MNLQQKTCLLILLLLSSSLFLYIRFSAVTQKQYPQEEISKILDEAYADISGFGIDASERNLIEEQGGNPTYGEITFKAMQELINYLNLGTTDTFFDLGSGVGKICCQVALTTPAHAIGIELSHTRYELAQKVKQLLMDKKVLLDSNKLLFIEQNILDADLNNATVIFTCSLCFSENLMQALTQKIQKIPHLKSILTLKELAAPHTGFALTKTFHLPMTWSENTAVYVYQRV